MVFTRKRGRPRLTRPQTDGGTEELQNKRKIGLTSEPLDVLLARQLINEHEHKAGLGFRWLYTVKFGLPGVRASDPSGVERKARSAGRDDMWQESKERKYARVVATLRKLDCKRVVFNLCIHQQWPYWLIDYQLLEKKTLSPLAIREIAELKVGLQEIAEIMQSGRGFCGGRG